MAASQPPPPPPPPPGAEADEGSGPAAAPEGESSGEQELAPSSVGPSEEPQAADEPGWSGIVMPVEPPEEVAEVTSSDTGRQEPDADAQAQSSEPDPYPDTGTGGMGEVDAYAAPTPSSQSDAPPPATVAEALSGRASNGFGAAGERLSPEIREASRGALTLVSHLIGGQEQVEGLVAGRYLGDGAVALLTDRQLWLVNERRWEPVVEQIPVDESLLVQGWDTGSTVAIVFTSGDRVLQVDDIPDKQVAYELAARIQARTGR